VKVLKKAFKQIELDAVKYTYFPQSQSNSALIEITTGVQLALDILEKPVVAAS
jgi:hypothetical protein